MCKLVQHGENTTYRVDSAKGDIGCRGVYVPGRYLARIHRPEYHTPAEIRSELTWLTALRAATGLDVPEPVTDRNGQLVIEATAPDVPEPRPVSLLRWMSGTFRHKRLNAKHITQLGRLTACLHEHAATWNPPAGFTRGKWDWDGLFGKNFGLGLSEQELWSLVPSNARGVFYEAAQHIGQTMATLGRGANVFGLIHADLHIGNVLFTPDNARPIDFDDCGYGYWLYDLAVIVDNLRNLELGREYEAALIAGYRQIRPLPVGYDEHRLDFVAARSITLTLWVCGMARINTKFAAWIPNAIEDTRPVIAEYLSRFGNGTGRGLPRTVNQRKRGDNNHD
ncbi:phosphotransferase [bacterium]|nr:phosphotransferase [bacterium]